MEGRSGDPQAGCRFDRAIAVPLQAIEDQPLPEGAKGIAREAARDVVESVRAQRGQVDPGARRRVCHEAQAGVAELASEDGFELPANVVPALFDLRSAPGANRASDSWRYRESRDSLPWRVL
jgi:hypothetical protein